MDPALQPPATLLARPVPVAPERPRPSLQVQRVCDRDGFLALARQWDALAARCDDQPFFRHGFLRLWLDHFGADANWRLLTLRDGRGRLAATLPLLYGTTRMYGLTVRELQSAANAHSCRFDLLADDAGVAADAFVSHLCEFDDWDMLRLVDVPPGGRAHALLPAAERAGLAVGRWSSLQSPYIELPAHWSEFESRLRTKFRANLRRRRRRLHELGEVSVLRVDGGATMIDWLDHGLRIEAGGWKGRAGTAILQSPGTQQFYRALAQQAADDGRLALWFLRLGERVIAFQFALEQGERLYLLKPAYDEGLADVSPGHLLIEDVLRDAIGRGLREFDFLGPDMPWKRDWTDRFRLHSWLYLFRGVRGRLLHRLKFQLAPTVKRMTGTP